MCAAPTNFLQWNPGKINQQTDLQYVADSQRTDGAVSGINPSILANKLFYQCTTMVAAIAQMMVNKGYEMQDTVLADLITSLSSIVTENSSKLIPSGTKMWFYQNTAPVGWTIDAAVYDSVIAVKGGSNAYNSSGGQLRGTWYQPDHYHATASHVLTESEMPSHTHLAPTTNGNEGPGDSTYKYELAQVDIHAAGFTYPNWRSSGWDYGSQAAPTDSTGGDASHSHGNTYTGATSSTWRPQAAVGIICTKD